MCKPGFARNANEIMGNTGSMMPGKKEKIDARQHDK
jgi:hypothetical protein